MAKHSNRKPVAAAVLIVGLCAGAIILCAGILAALANR